MKGEETREMRDIIIKRQQAEIELLRTYLKDLETEYDAYKEAVEVALVEARAEAVREFAERLKKELNITGNGGWFEIGESGLIGAIDDLVKEMTEKEGGKG